MKLTIGHKLWLECRGEPLVGRGRYQILKTIDATHSLQRTAAKLHIAEKTIYNALRKMESRLGKKVVLAKKGGKSGGASLELTDEGKSLMRQYEQAQKQWQSTISASR